MSKQAALKTRELRKAQVAIAEARGRRSVGLIMGMAIVFALVLAIAVSLVHSASSVGRASSGQLVVPHGATAAGALAAGKATAPVKVEVYLDYMCPYCGRFERANGEDLNRLVADGTVKLELYPMSFLDKTSRGSRYSTRAANAAATVAHRSPESFLAFNQALFAKQPEEGTRGLSDADLAKLARDAGVSRDVVADFKDRTFETWVASSTEAVFRSGVTGTPTIKINGEVFGDDLYTRGALATAVAAAAPRS